MQDPTARFLSKVNKNGPIIRAELGPCWIWTAGHDPTGYGFFWWRQRQNRAHRASWELFVGDIPPGLFICHRCDNHPCVNVEHLFLGTHRDNQQDSLAKGRTHSARMTHCKHGHPYVEGNIYLDPKNTAHRSCLTCRRERNAERHARETEQRRQRRAAKAEQVP